MIGLCVQVILDSGHYCQNIDSDEYSCGANEPIVRERFYKIRYLYLIPYNLMYIHTAMI